MSKGMSVEEDRKERKAESDLMDLEGRGKKFESKKCVCEVIREFYEAE